MTGNSTPTIHNARLKTVLQYRFGLWVMGCGLRVFEDASP
jgi:hypothetical protein